MLISDQKTITGVPAAATDKVEDLPDPDLILVCVKSYDLDGAIQAILPKVHENTVILPLLNGADIYERIRKNMAAGIVLPACVYVGTHIQAPGVIYQSGGDGRILFGADPKYARFDPKQVTDFSMPCRSIINGAPILIRISGANTCLLRPLPGDGVFQQNHR